MCGIFGFINRGGDGPKLDRLKKIAAITERRGNHAFGLAWQDADGNLHSWKTPGPATRNLDAIDQLADAKIIIGHCRYATHGCYHENRNNHPHPSGSGYIVHNGMICNYLDLAFSYNLEMQTECDSEVFGLLVARKSGPLHTRFAHAAGECEGALAIMGIWKDKLCIVRRGNPVHFGMLKSGDLYFGSLAEGLPGDVSSMTDDYAVGMTVNNPESMNFVRVVSREMESHPILFRGE